jgi:hypothetical protein
VTKLTILDRVKYSAPTKAPTKSDFIKDTLSRNRQKRDALSSGLSFWLVWLSKHSFVAGHFAVRIDDQNVFFLFCVIDAYERNNKQNRCIHLYYREKETKPTRGRFTTNLKSMTNPRKHSKSWETLWNSWAQPLLAFVSCTLLLYLHAVRCPLDPHFMTSSCSVP